MLYGELPEVQSSSGETLRGILVKIRKPPKTAVVRLPTPEELLNYLRQQKTLVRSLGRKKTETEAVPTPKLDLSLFSKIRIDKAGPEFNEFEAGTALSRITEHGVLSVEPEGDDAFTIVLDSRFGKTTHVLAMPTEQDITIYRRRCFHGVNVAGGVQERRFPPEAPAELYDSVVRRIEGYVSNDKKDVPPHHKSTLVVELLTKLDDLDQDSDADPNSLAPEEWPSPPSLRLLIFRSIRQAELCPEADPESSGCPAATEVSCVACRNRWEPPDASRPGTCANCGGRRVRIERCEGCPLEMLDHVKEASRAGRLLARVLDLDFAMSNLTIPWHRVTAEEVRGVRILREERERFHNQKAEERERELKLNQSRPR